jgi:hypothetical protein
MCPSTLVSAVWHPPSGQLPRVEDHAWEALPLVVAPSCLIPGQTATLLTRLFPRLAAGTSGRTSGRGDQSFVSRSPCLPLGRSEPPALSPRLPESTPGVPTTTGLRRASDRGAQRSSPRTASQDLPESACGVERWISGSWARFRTVQAPTHSAPPRPPPYRQRHMSLLRFSSPPRGQPPRWRLDWACEDGVALSGRVDLVSTAASCQRVCAPRTHGMPSPWTWPDCESRDLPANGSRLALR